jgi:sterol 24-C-methyltransferase
LGFAVAFDFKSKIANRTTGRVDMPGAGSKKFYADDATRGRVQGEIDEYLGFFDGDAGRDPTRRQQSYTRMVNDYYDLVTDFYEYGWGQSFHFAPRYKGEPFHDSLKRHQHFLAMKAGLRPGVRALDVGCGVGGPMREIARFSGASVEGINNNAYQVERAQKKAAAERLAHLCGVTKGDFMRMPFDDGSFGAAYAIEATCHAPDRAGVFREIHRVLQPGALFASYEWILTDRYDASNPEHREIKHGIERGDGLPDLLTAEDVHDALRTAGFELVEATDRAHASDPETPWFLPLAGESWSVTAFPKGPVGRVVSHTAVRVMERLRIAPKGSTAVSGMLNAAAEALVAGGRAGIFTPAWFVLARKRA